MPKTSDIRTVRTPRDARRRFCACVKHLSSFFGMGYEVMDIRDAVSELSALDPEATRRYGALRGGNESAMLAYACKSSFDMPGTGQPAAIYSFLVLLDSMIYGSSYESMSLGCVDGQDVQGRSRTLDDMATMFSWLLYTMFCYMDFPHRRDFRHFMWEDEYINMKFQVGKDVPEYARAIAKTRGIKLRKAGTPDKLLALALRDETVNIQRAMTKYVPYLSFYQGVDIATFIDDVGAGAFPKLCKPNFSDDAIAGELGLEEWNEISRYVRILSKIWLPPRGDDAPTIWAVRAISEYEKLMKRKGDPRKSACEAIKLAGVGECVSAILDGVPEDDALA